MLDVRRRRSLEVKVTRFSLSRGNTKTTMNLAEQRGAHAADGVFQILRVNGEDGDGKAALLTTSVDGATGKPLALSELYTMWVWFTLHLFKLAQAEGMEGVSIRKFCGMVLSHLGLEQAAPAHLGPVILASKGSFEPATQSEDASEPSSTSPE